MRKCIQTFKVNFQQLFQQFPPKINYEKHSKNSLSQGNSIEILQNMLSVNFLGKYL